MEEKILVSIEGCIAAGKTFLLDKIKENSNFCIIEEPLDLWTNLKDDNGESILELFYEDKVKYSFHFQLYALITRYKNIKNTINNNKDKKIFISERSISADRFIFFEMLKDSKFLSSIEKNIYLELFLLIEKEIPPISAVINVNSNADLCYERAKMRNRKGEEDISKNYLSTLINYQKEWLDNTNIKVLSCTSDDNELVENFILSLI